MSISNHIKLLLDIQDKNIIFEDNAVQIMEYKGQTAKFITGKLTYVPTHCEACGIKNENYIIYKNGTKTSRITLPIAGIYPTYLNLKKQRFFCKACNTSFIAKTSIVEENCFISANTKAKVLIQSTAAHSLTDIAKDCYVSTTTIQRIITKESKAFKPYYQALPKHLSFDEFKYAKGKMAFEYIDVETGNILDILKSRDARTIKEHFTANYCLQDLKPVETITIDMNAGYVNVIKDIFPQANIIIDRFHLVQLISRSMNKTRVRIMNRFNTSCGEDKKKYRRLKRYWKLLLKKEDELSYTEYKYYAMFGQRLEGSVVDEMLNYDDELKENYKLYQSLLRSMTNRDFDTLKNTLEKSGMKHISTYIKTSLKTLRKHLPYIKNSFIYPYNNGRIEGINNKIKVLNRVAYGYRNFSNFKNRIMLHFKCKSVVDKSKQKETHSQAA